MVKVGIIGASGYTGLELLRLALNHPRMRVKYLTAERYAGTPAAALYPSLSGLTDIVYEGFLAEKALSRADVLFVAVPHGKAMEIVPHLVGNGKKVIDLSGDFRLSSAEEYEAWYGTPHVAPQLLGEAVYGLPELFAEHIKGADFVSNPGCFPTGVLLALAPLVARGMVDAAGPVISALTGVSGAGRALTLETQFCTVDGNLTPYKVGGLHQHIPEMEKYLGHIAGEKVTVSFTPHLVPVSRGVLVTAHVGVRKKAPGLGEGDLVGLYEEFYRGKPFVKVLAERGVPQTKSVVGSNYCHVAVRLDRRTGRVIAMSAIDNLVKGAAGQAIQNMNLMCGFLEDKGLTAVGLFP